LGAFLSWSAILTLPLSTATSSFAGSAHWKTNPTSGDWNTAANWMPATVPNGPLDTASFATSSQTAVSLSANTEVNMLFYRPGASAFVTTVGNAVSLTLSGVGITNHSGNTQDFLVTAVMQFTNSATAGSSTNFTVGSSSGLINFSDTSSAGNGVFSLVGLAVLDFFDSSTAANGTFTFDSSEIAQTHFNFFDGSTAGRGTFTLHGSVVGVFDGTASAGNSLLTINGGQSTGGGSSFLAFSSFSTAGTATLVANGGFSGGIGGTIRFNNASIGGTSRVEVFGNGTGDITNGNVDVGQHNLPGVTIGSIEGNGAVFLGNRNLTVGSNNVSTTFSGKIQDGGSSGQPLGSLTKSGTGTLTLTKANTYTGGTTISAGTLLVRNTSGSGTGPSAVQVSAGTLGGTGRIDGPVTVGTGSGPGAFLSPGASATIPGTFTIQNQLTFQADATYNYGLKSSNATADKVIANGVTITGALFSFAAIGTGTLAHGAVFTAIKNVAATPIAGTFSNLADGSVFTIGNNTYQVSYEGNDGNDLTLTVQ
jgi:autotransporter-associated beta strand protein